MEEKTLEERVENLEKLHYYGFYILLGLVLAYTFTKK